MKAARHLRFSQISILLGSVLGWFSVASALELNVPNPILKPSGKGAAGTVAVPSKWKLVAGKKENCIRWQGENAQGAPIFHTAIGRGVTLSSQVPVSALTDKEKKVKGEWSGVLSVDTLGTAVSGTGSWELGVYLPGKASPITTLSGQTRKTAKLAQPNIMRHWLELSPKVMQELEGKTVELRLASKGAAPVVVSGISFSRLHSAPSKRLFGRSNGGNGPDLLGAGSLGFDGMTEHRQRILTVIDVRKDTPAARAGLKAGDKIVGVNRRPLPVNDLRPGWEWYYRSHESVLGRAVVAAWSKKPPAGRGIVILQVLRKGKPVSLRCKLSQPMDFGNLAHSKQKAVMHQQMVDFLCKTQQKDGSWRGPIQTTFSALALLATEDPAHAPRIKKAVDWMMNKYPEPENFGNLGFWFSSYAGILYCEYYLATGDKRVLERISPILDWVMSGLHTSKWGMPCLGHGVGGLPYGQKALVAPACHALVFDALAERCGVHSGLWKTLLPYMEHSWSDPAKGGHGSLGYNASYKDKGEFWSRSGLFAMAAHLRRERTDMEDAMTGFMVGHHPWFRNSHAYGEPGGALGILGLNLCRADAYEKVMNAYGWWFALAWEPNHGLRFTTPHMGAPYMGTEDLINAAYALVFAAPKKSLFITGGSKRNWLDVSGLETAPNPVIVRRDKSGHITLSCRIPGPTIRYTLDGSIPNKESAAYTSPIPFPQGGTIKARAYGSGLKPGEVATAAYGPAKSGWKVIAASGHKEPAEAVRRATYAIDHSRTHSWLTDVGQDAKGYPHFIVIDLGRETTLRALNIEFVRDRGAAKQCIIKGSKSLNETPFKLAEATWDTYQATQRVELKKPVPMRYLRLELATPVTENGISLMIREITVE